MEDVFYKRNGVLKKSIGESLFKIICNREIKATGIKNGSLKKSIGNMRGDFNGRLISVV